MYAKNTDLGSLSRSLKSLTLCGEQVVKLHDIHNGISIELSAAENTIIEVLPLLLDLDRSSHFNVLLVPPIDHILHLL